MAKRQNVKAPGPFVYTSAENGHKNSGFVARKGPWSASCNDGNLTWIKWVQNLYVYMVVHVERV